MRLLFPIPHSRIPSPRLTVSLLTMRPRRDLLRALRPQRDRGARSARRHGGRLQLRHVRFRAGGFPAQLRARAHALPHRRRCRWPTTSTMYRDEGRSIVEQRLDLTPAQAQRLAAISSTWNARPENALLPLRLFPRQLLDARARRARPRARRPAARADRRAVRAATPIACDADAPDGAGAAADARHRSRPRAVSRTSASTSGRKASCRCAAGRRRPGRHWPTASSAGRGHERDSPRTRIAEPPALPPDLRVAVPDRSASPLGALLLWLGRAAPRRARSAGGVRDRVRAVLRLGGLLLLFLWFGTEHRAAWRNENLLLLDPLVPAAAAGVARSRVRAGGVARFAIGVASLVVRSPRSRCSRRSCPGSCRPTCLDRVAAADPPGAGVTLMRA